MISKQFARVHKEWLMQSDPLHGNRLLGGSAINLYELGLRSGTLLRLAATGSKYVHSNTSLEKFLAKMH